MSRKMFYSISFLYLLGLFCAVFILFRQSAAQKGKTSLNFFSKDFIAVVRIYGPISISSEYPNFGFSRDADRIVNKLHKLNANRNVKAVVLRINSPGGSVAAVQEICQEVNRLRNSNKIVVASIGDIAASGGYYIASQADKIVADPGSITGSIGAKIELTNMQELLKKIGLRFDSITSGKYKDIGSPFRELLPDEKEILQNITNDAYSQFLGAVAQGRKMDMEKLKKLADGRIFSGSQAKNLGLVDELGNIEDAISIAAKMSGIKPPPKIIADYDSDSIISLLGYFGELSGIGSISKILGKYKIGLDY